MAYQRGRLMRSARLPPINCFNFFVQNRKVLIIISPEVVGKCALSVYTYK